jgi:hypothetical protein
MDIIPIGYQYKLYLEERFKHECWYPLSYSVPNFQYVKEHLSEFLEIQKFKLMIAPEFTSLSGMVRFIVLA